MDLPDWQADGKVDAPRVILAKLALSRDLEAVNRYIAASEPRAGVGSTWALRRNGDYDFSLPGLTAALYLYGNRPDVLFPETRDHLLDILLNQDGPGFRTTVPGSLGLVQETENHILMTEGSRYLKNQWIAQYDPDPRFDNVTNGLEAKLIDFISDLDTAGLYEFNSNPYAGYTLMALLTLEAFADAPVADAARSLIDRLNFEFVLGSVKARRYPPFRRQTRRADVTNLLDHGHTSMMLVWLDRAGVDVPDVQFHSHQAVYAALMPYRLPLEDAERLSRSTDQYYARIGRGPRSSPEIYAAGDGFLISAGGTGRRFRSQIVARPITVILDDGVVDAGELFSVGGAGDYVGWNNTGVLPGVAIARGPLHIPPGWTPDARVRNWSVYYDEKTGVKISAGDDGTEGGTAVLYVLDRADQISLGLTAQELADRLATLSPASVLASGALRLPDGRSIGFDLRAGANRWVITSVNGVPTDRDMTAWPRLDSSVPFDLAGEVPD